jgi:hypothetical protein
VTSQNAALVPEQLKKHGVRFGMDLVMKSNGRPSINAETFRDSILIVLLPNLAEFRGRSSYRGPSVTVFGFLKEKSTLEFIRKVSHDFNETMVELNLWGAFQAFGFEFNTRNE